jgi:drug/metabolite transporter (DMT)-like permease
LSNRRTLLWTATALVAFAANSWLCRAALRGGSIDPVAFTTLRVASGALLLWPLARWLEPGGGGSWRSGAALFAYAIAFSLAYVVLDTGTGALILFGAVQVTMIGAGMLHGERPAIRQWVGLAAALGGLVWLVSPGLSAPHPAGALSMAAAGAAWGAYSLRGRGQSRPIAETAGNFLRATPLALAASAVASLGSGSWRPGATGVLLAIASGTLTSGLGYAVWYAAVRGLSSTTAAIVQLAVPLLAAVGGVALLGERASLRLALASVPILGGVALALRGRRD